MRKLRLRLIVGLSIVAFMSAGCASLSGVLPGTDSAKTTAWKTLMTNKQLYDKVFKALNLLDIQGKLSAQTKADAIKAGNYYVTAHNAAVQALLSDQSIDLKFVSAALDAFLAIAYPYYLEVK